MNKQISITIDEQLLTYIDEVAEINGRSRSGMIAWLIKKCQEEDEALDQEAKYRIAKCNLSSTYGSMVR